MTTALDTVTGSLRLLGVVGASDVPSPEDTAVALTAFNEMLESWSTHNLAIFTPVDQVFTLTPGTSAYTLGPSGVWTGFRPIQIDQVRVSYQTIIYQVDELDNARFNAIPYPAQTGVLPIWFNYDPTVPNGTVNLWPVPTQAIQIILSSNQQLAQIASLATTLVLPPGYKRAIRYNLAKDLQGEFGAPLSPLALQIAATSLGDIKRANVTPVRAEFDPALTDGGGNGSRLANFISGLY